MYDKNLLDLVDKKTHLKFKVTPEQSKELQEMLFNHGVFWIGDPDRRKDIVETVNFPFLFLTMRDERGYVLTQNNDSDDYFNNHPSTEYDLTNKCLLEKTEKKDHDKIVEKIKERLLFERERVNIPISYCLSDPANYLRDNQTRVATLEWVLSIMEE